MAEMTQGRNDPNNKAESTHLNPPKTGWNDQGRNDPGPKLPGSESKLFTGNSLVQVHPWWLIVILTYHQLTILILFLIPGPGPLVL